MSQSAFSQGLKQLKKFNQFVLENPELRAFFIDGDYDFLQAYQVFLFSDLSNLYGAVGWGETSGAPVTKTGIKIRLRQIIAIFWSLLSWLWFVVSRREVLIFGADRDTSSTYYCDFRASNLYRCLIERKVKFVEFFHTIFDRAFIGRTVRRGRPSVHLELIDTLYKLYNLLKLVRQTQIPTFQIEAGEDTELFKNLVSKYFHLTLLTRFRIKILRWLLGVSNIKVVVGSADMRYYQELYEASRMLGIKTCAFLGGTISKYYVEYVAHSKSTGRVMKPGFLIVESDFWRKELMRWGTYFAPEEIMLGGNLKEDHIFVPAETKAKNDDETITVMFPYETIAPKDEILKYIEKLTSHPQITVVFKFRPHRDIVTQAREYRLDNLHRDNLKIISDLREIEDFDIIAGTYSTYLYEMIGKLKPVIILKTTLDWGEGLAFNKLAEELSLNEPNLLERLKEIKDTPDDILLKRRQVLFGEVIPLAETLDSILS